MNVDILASYSKDLSSSSHSCASGVSLDKLFGNISYISFNPGLNFYREGFEL